MIRAASFKALTRRWNWMREAASDSHLQWRGKHCAQRIFRLHSRELKVNLLAFSIIIYLLWKAIRASRESNIELPRSINIPIHTECIYIYNRVKTVDTRWEIHPRKQSNLLAAPLLREGSIPFDFLSPSRRTYLSLNFAAENKKKQKRGCEAGIRKDVRSRASDKRRA